MTAAEGPQCETVLINTCARAYRVVCVCTGHPADRCRRRSAKPGVTAAEGLQCETVLILLVHVLIVMFLSVQVLVLTQTYEAIGGSAYSLSPGLAAA